MGSLLIGIIYFWIWIFGELGIFGYFPVLGLVGWGPGGFVNWFNVFLDIGFLGAGYFPTLGLVGQGLGDFVNYNILLDIGYLGSWILSDIFQLWVWLAGGLGVAVEWQAAPNAPPDNKPSPTFEMRMLVMMMMMRVMMKMMRMMEW